MSKIQNIGLLTSGGDSPGMNAAIRAVTRAGVYHGLKVYGFNDGFRGLLDQNYCELKYDDVSNILQRGGTILGTARCPEFLEVENRKVAFDNLKSLEIDALVVIGGDGSFSGANLFAEEFPIVVIGIPGTIDNDIVGTDYTIGFDTALNNIIEAIDKIRDTASSHHRVFLVEVMGNNSGVLALHAAAASGAEEVFMPEKQDDLFEIKEKIRKAVSAKKSSIIIVAEGDQIGGAKEVYQSLEDEVLQDKIRVSILGHIQRGGSPTFLDRLNATLFGEHAVVALIKGKSNLMIGMQAGKIVEVNLAGASTKKMVDQMDYLKLIRKLSVY
ncbi:6-phosphofructokinase [Crocinitomix catalasitica]|nr:6-phosphofructokinase [Crocinitomix catalasitica]